MNKPDLHEVIWDEKSAGPKHLIPRPDVRLRIISSPCPIPPILTRQRRLFSWLSFWLIVEWFKYLPVRIGYFFSLLWFCLKALFQKDSTRGWK